MLNKTLIAKQLITKKAERALNTLHELLDDIIESPREYGTPTDVLTLITDIEYTMQTLWKFPKSAAYHRHSYRLKECTCPYHDNMDMVGHTQMRVVNTTCPYHSTVFNKDSK